MFSARARMAAWDIAIHIVLAAIFAWIIYSKSGSLLYAGIFMAGGIFIDLDHFIDHFLFFKNKFSPEDFLQRAFLKSGKVYLFFIPGKSFALFFL